MARTRRTRRSVTDPDPIGARRLREIIARRILTRRGIESSPEEVIIVSEAQQGLDLAARILLNPGDVALVEEPHYNAARHLFLAAGASVATVRLDGDGADLPSTPHQHQIKLVYLTPTSQFPIGVQMSDARRRSAREWCERHDAWLLEDDFNAEYQYNGRRHDAIKANDASGRVVYLATLARSISPSVRLGFMVVPPALRDAFASAKCVMDRGAFAFDQDVLADFIETGCYDRHLLRMCRLYAAKRQRLQVALRTHFGATAEITTRSPGLHVFVRFPQLQPVDVPMLLTAAQGLGVTIDDASPFYLGAPASAEILLGYGATPIEKIEDGVRRLAEAYREVCGGSGVAVD